MDVSGALNLLTAMKSAGLQPDEVGLSCVKASPSGVLLAGPKSMHNVSPLVLPTLQASYTLMIELMVRSKQPNLAVQLCSEAHDAG